MMKLEKTSMRECHGIRQKRISMSADPRCDKNKFGFMNPWACVFLKMFMADTRGLFWGCPRRAATVVYNLIIG